MTTPSIKNHIIHIRSQDCVQPTQNTSYIQCRISEPITCKNDEEIYVSVLSSTIPFTWYNVNYTNNKLNVKETLNSTDAYFTITLPMGNYNIIQIMSFLKTQLNDNSPLDIAYNITYDKYTNKLHFTTSTIGARIGFLFQTGPETKFDCQYVLGFHLIQDKYWGYNDPLISDSTTNVSPIENIYIVSNSMGLQNEYSSLGGNSANILAKIPVDTVPFSFIYYKNLMFLTHKTSLFTISSFDLQLVDMDGSVIDLNNNNWFITLRFSIHKKQEQSFKALRDELYNIELNMPEQPEEVIPEEAQ
jgi:hypothetical protein